MALPLSRPTYDYSAVYRAMLAFAQSHNGSLPSARALAPFCGVRSGPAMLYILARLREAGLVTRRDGVLVIEGAQWKPPKPSRRS